jgi:serine/threonine protein kinase
MDRVVALKLLAAPYSQSQVFRQRLYREARAAGRLHEPHVVPVHQCGEIDGQLYIDMRLIKDTDLQTVLARDGPLSPARAVAIMRQIASALDAAHSEQMIHRDVKPANILVTGDYAALRAVLAAGTLGRHNGLPATIIVVHHLARAGGQCGHRAHRWGTLLPISEVIGLARHAHQYLATFDKGRATGLYHTKRLASPAQRPCCTPMQSEVVHILAAPVGLV